MNKEEKIKIVDNLKHSLTENKNIYFTEVFGLDAQQTSQLRRMCFEKGVHLSVVKNTLLRKAMDACDKDSYKKIILKGGHIEESMYLGHEQLDVLVALKSKEELIGDVIMLLQSPMKNLLSSLGSAKQNISSLLTALENNPNVELKNKKDNVESESSSEEPAAEQSSSEEPLEDSSID